VRLSGSGGIKVYADAQKATEINIITDPMHGKFPIKWTLDSTANPPIIVPSTVYVEGISSGTASLTLTVNRVTNGVETAITHDTVAFTVVQLDIKMGTTVITNQLTNTIIGKKISLNVTRTPSTITPSSYSWTIPGIRIANYTANDGTSAVSAASAHVTSLTVTNLDNINYYWVDGSGSTDRVIQCTVQYGQSTIPVKCKFHIKSPTHSVDAHVAALVPPNTHSVRVYNMDNIGLGLWSGDYNTDSTCAAWFHPIVTGFSETGEAIGFVQIVDNYEMHRVETVDQSHWKSIYSNVYDGSNFPSVRKSPGNPDFHDTPGLLMEKYDHASRSDSFSTYLMYKPCTSDSIWVPLEKIDWNWAGVADRIDQNTWQLTGTPTDPNITLHTDWTTHPEWNENNSNEYVEPE